MEHYLKISVISFRFSKNRNTPTGMTCRGIKTSENESDLGVRGVFISLSFFFSVSPSLCYHPLPLSLSTVLDKVEVEKPATTSTKACVSNLTNASRHISQLLSWLLIIVKTPRKLGEKNNKCRYFPKHKQLQSQSRRATPFGEPLHWYWLGCCRCIGAATLFDFYVIYLFYRTLKFLIIFATSVNRVF